MLRQLLTKAARATPRGRPQVPITAPSRSLRATYLPRTAQAVCSNLRPLSTSPSLRRGILPDTDDPQPKQSAETVVPLTPAEITDTEYHELADQYLDLILTKLEERQDEQEGIDVEYSAGVLTISFGSDRTYVINKQPPNKQIWLSSPRSGPKRYDWVIQGDGQHQKEGTGVGDWIYIRDGSTLGSLFHSELNIDLTPPIHD